MALTMRNISALSAEAESTQTKYQQGLNYHRQAGFLAEWPAYERMKAGDQWAPPTAQTRNLPRPVFNIIDLIESLKVSMVMSEQIMMHFSTQDSGDEASQGSAELFTKYSDTLWEDIKQNEINEEMLEIAANTGTGIIHYYWDAHYRGGNKVKYAGKLCGEVLDPINVFFSNPQNRSVQAQTDIIISYRAMLKAVKQEAKANGLSKTLVALIGSDDRKLEEAYDPAMIEVQGPEKVTCLLHYYRGDNGNIWFKKVCSGMVVKPATDTGMKLYPIAVMQWKRRRKSIHGVGDTKGLIPNQRAINFLIAMSILSAQLTGWPKMLIDPLKVNKSKITNEPGEIIEIEGGAATGLETAIRFMSPSVIAPGTADLVGQIIDLTRGMASANESATGEAPGANMAASAIMQLQKANGVPVESVKRRFYQMCEDIGRIWEEFFKVRYNMPRQVKIKDDMGKDAYTDFTGTDHAGVETSLKIDIGPSSQYSEALMMASLDRFLDNQYISFEQYLEYAPANVVPFKDRLLKELEAQKEAAAAQAAKNPISTLPPEAQAMFATLPPEEQQKIMQQAQMGGQTPPQGVIA